MRLVFGRGDLERVVDNAELWLLAYRTDDGLRYLDHQLSTPPDRLAPEDLAVTLLTNARISGRTFKSVQDRGGELPVGSLPPVPLEATDAGQRSVVAAMLATMASWPGFEISVAAALLHKKRPDLVPLLDDQAIFGAYLDPGWPDERSVGGARPVDRVAEAIDAIHFDLTRPENVAVWPALQRKARSRTLVEVFDMIWWSYFRSREPVPPRSPS